MSKAGFTGTREGLTGKQVGELTLFLSVRQFDAFHHGACLGADEKAVEIVSILNARPVIVAHPGPETAYSSRRAVRLSDEVRPVKHFLTRNCDIVNETDILIACPEGPEKQRSGTWATIRYARKLKKPIVIFWPDGTKTVENEPT